MTRRNDLRAAIMCDPSVLLAIARATVPLHASADLEDLAEVMDELTGDGGYYPGVEDAAEEAFGERTIAASDALANLRHDATKDMGPPPGRDPGRSDTLDSHYVSPERERWEQDCADATKQAETLVREQAGRALAGVIVALERSTMPAVRNLTVVPLDDGWPGGRAAA